MMNVGFGCYQSRNYILFYIANKGQKSENMDQDAYETVT